MHESRPKPAAIGRRGFLGGVAGVAAALASVAELAPAAETAKLSLSAYDKIPAQKFPWGWIRWLMSDQIDPKSELTVGIVFIEPKQSNPLHVHPNSAEVVHILSGSCQQRVDDKWMKLQAGDTLRIPQNVPHLARTEDEPCLVMVVYNTGKRQMVPVTAGK